MRAVLSLHLHEQSLTGQWAILYTGDLANYLALGPSVRDMDGGSCSDMTI